MFDRITLSNGVLHFHAGDTSLATTKAFTHGGMIFDPSGSVAIAKIPPVPLPAGLDLAEGKTIVMQLVAPDGKLKKQTRSGVLSTASNCLLRIPGLSRTPSACSAEDGWGYTVRKYRAYITHPGVSGSPDLPAWLLHSIERQRNFWNRLAARLKQVREACSDVPTEEVRQFVNETILPAIEAFNQAPGRKAKLQHPKDLKVDDPSLTAVWRFAGKLAKLSKQGKPIPDGLEDTVVSWAKLHKVELGPFRQFERDLRSLMNQDAETFRLRSWEATPKSKAFYAALERRRTLHLPFSKGWPRFIQTEDPCGQDWGIHFYLNRAGIPADAPFVGKLSSLQIGASVPPENTGHATHRGKRFRARRTFRPVEIAIPDRVSKEIWQIRCSIVQHQPIPKDAFLKQWSLIYEKGRLWLCLLFQARQVAGLEASSETAVAGMDLGWRREEDGIKVATFWNPVRKTFQNITVNLTAKAPDTKARAPLAVYMGPSYKSRQLAEQAKTANKEAYLDTYEGCGEIQQARDRAKDSIKSLITRELGSNAPAWLRKAGSAGIKKLAAALPASPLTVAIDKWILEDVRLRELHRDYSVRIQARLQKSYEWVANDLGKILQADKIPILALEENFLQHAAQTESGTGQEALRRSTRYRQWVAPATLAATLERILPKYGVRVVRVKAKDTTRKCHYCRTINETVDEYLFFQCTGCGRAVQQDENAAVNIAEASTSSVR